MSSDNTLNQIIHYQKKLEKYAAHGETEKLLCCIHKLKYLPVTVSHLEETGVGKSINALRHKNGIIGEKARALVNKWKAMVAEEETEEPSENLQKIEKKDSKVSVKCNAESSPKLAENEDEYDPSDEGDRLQIQEEQGEEGMENVTYNPGGISVDNEEENFNGYNPRTSREDYLSAGVENEEKNFIEYNPRTSREDYLSAGVRIDHETYSPSRKDTVDTKPDYIGHSRSPLPNGDSHTENSKKEKSHSSSSEEKHKKKKHKSRHGNRDKHHHEDDNSNNNSSSSHKKSKHKSSSKSKEKKKYKEKDSRKNKHKSHSSSKSHSSHNKHRSDVSSSKSSPSLNASNDNTCNYSNSSELKRLRESDDECESPSKKRDLTQTADEKRHKDKSHSSKTSKDEQKPSKRTKGDSASSSGFGAALLELDSNASKKKKKKKSKQKENLSTSPIYSINSPSHCPESKPSLVKDEDILPELPAFMNEEDTDVPQLMTHYKPLPHVPQRTSSKDPFTSQMTNEEALNYMLSSKNNKQRRIYAGKTSVLCSVPSLFDICIKILQENIDALEYTGGIPFDILRPILEKATPQQLFVLEDYNPYLLEDTDSLWATHCRKCFKGKQRQDMETWRDMFVRCTDEHEVKMRNVTEILQKKYITKAPPKRTTQLAFINTAAKPPKSVARAQARYGTAATYSAPVKAASRTDEPQKSASSNSSNTVPKPEKSFPNKPPTLKKPKVAPLMGKARQLMKKVCRR